MTKRAFDKIAAGLNEALAVARGEAKPARVYIPAEIDVKAIRKSVKLTQDGFASAFGFTVSQIRDWEQGRSRPLHSDRAYLMLIESNPRWVLEALNGVKSAGITKAA